MSRKDVFLLDADAKLATAFIPSIQKIMYATHDIASTGLQVITGVGFKPTSAIFISGVSNTDLTSIGMTDGVFSGCANNNNGIVAGQWDVASGHPIQLTKDGSNNSRALVTSFDADGLTLLWSKTGVMSGTARIRMLLLR